VYANWHFKWFHSYPPTILADNSDLQVFTRLYYSRPKNTWTCWWKTGCQYTCRMCSAGRI